jgi:hypothetical protein
VPGKAVARPPDAAVGHEQAAGERRAAGDRGAVAPARATRDQVLAFRLDGHHLVDRGPLGELVDVAAASGVRNTPPGSAALALHARVAGLTPDAVDRALAEDKTLVEVLGVRASPQVVPARDAAVFTLGALPADEASVRAALLSLAPALDRAGLPAIQALEQAAEVAREELDGRMLTRGALSEAMTRRLPEVLGPWCRACKSRHVHEMLFRLVGVRGVFVILRAGKDTVYVRTDRWLGGAPAGDRGVPPTRWHLTMVAARAELLRRYLRCYGPSTVGHFAAWVGIAPADARRSWDRIADRLVAVNLDGRRAWLHAGDVARLESPPEAAGVRLLPPYDAYLDQRDRATLLPDKALHRRVWRILGNPGVVLADGQVVGLWRPQKKGRRLVVTVETFAPLSREARAELDAEAALLAPYRGCTSADVAYAD